MTAEPQSDRPLAAASKRNRINTLPPSANGGATLLLAALQAATAVAFGVELEEMRSPSRRAANVAFARQSAMYLAHVLLGLNFSAIGLFFDRDRTTAAHACKIVEDRRDDPLIDCVLQQLEDTFGHLRCRTECPVRS